MASERPDWLPEEYADLMNPEVAKGVLESLRLKPDQQFINPFGEHVWLRQVTREECAQSFEAAGIDPARAHAHLTDCCFVGEECERHRVKSQREGGSADEQ